MTSRRDASQADGRVNPSEPKNGHGCRIPARQCLQTGPDGVQSGIPESSHPRMGSLSPNSIQQVPEGCGPEMRPDVTEPSSVVNDPLNDTPLTSQNVSKLAQPCDVPKARGSIPTQLASSKTEDDEYRPFPMEALPTPLKRFVVNAAASIGCDASFIALPMFAVLAAAIGNTSRLRLKNGWDVPPIVWAVLVGGSGNLKSPALKQVLKPLEVMQQRLLMEHACATKQYASNLAAFERDNEVWKRKECESKSPPEKPVEPQAQRILVSDTTTEALAPILQANPRGLLLTRDELSGWVGGFDRYASGNSKSDASHWLSVFRAESITVDRKTGLLRTIHVPQACVSVCGGIQPDTLRRIMSRDLRESGLMARMVFAFPPRRVRVWSEAEIAPEIEQDYDRVVRRLFGLECQRTESGSANLRILTLEEAAKAAWVDWDNNHNRESESLTGDLLAAWCKLEEYVPRIALILQLTRWAANSGGCETVDLQSMKSAIALVEWFKGETRRVYRLFDPYTPNGDDRRQRLLKFIASKGGAVSAREVQQGCAWLKQTAEGAAMELQKLVEEGWGDWENIPSGPQGGRPMRIFRLKLPESTEPQ